MSTLLQTQKLPNYALPLSKEEERELLKEAQNDNEEARDELIIKNQGLVHMWAGKYAGRDDKNENYTELVQQSTIGLCRAIEMFDLTRPHKFSTYASWWIRNKIYEWLYNSSSIRVPRREYTLLRQAKQNFPDATAEELAREMVKRRYKPPHTAQKVRIMMNTIMILDRGCGSLERCTSDLRGGTTFPNPKATDPCLQLQQKEQGAAINNLLQSILTPREYLVIALRFGLEGRPRHILSAVGGKLGIGKERVRQIEKNALSKVRDSSKAKDLKAELLP